MNEEKLTQQQQLAAQLIAVGGKPKQEIAEDIGIARATLYNWMSKESFKAEVDRLRLDFKNFGMDLMLSKLHKSIENIVDISNTSKNDMVKFNANTYLVDRIYGKIPSNINLTTEVDNKKVVDEDILDMEYKRFEAEVMGQDETE